MTCTSSKHKRPASAKRGAHIVNAKYSIKSPRLRKLAHALTKKLRPQSEEEETELCELFDTIARAANAYARREACKAVKRIGGLYL